MSVDDNRAADIPQPPARTAVAAALLASCAPLVLLVFNRDWLLTPEGYLDPWHYVGLFREYWNPDYSPGAYKLARLPWILSGALATRVLPPLAAAFVLHALYLCAMTLTFFVGLHSLFRRTALAAVVSLCLGFYTHVHGSGGWDYHNTAAGAFYMATFMMLARPSTVAGRPLSVAIAGALAALAVHTNITFVNFLPALAFVHLRMVQLRLGALPPIRAILVRTGWALTGALAITAALGLVNWSVGREFLFFEVLVNIVSRYVGDARYVAGYKMGPGWYFTAKHLSLPAAVFVIGAVMLVWRRRARANDERLATALIVQFLCMCMVWIGWQAAGQLALDWDYYAYVLIPSCFIAIAGILLPVWPAACERHWLAITLATAGALALGLASPPELLPAVSATGPIAGVISVVGGAVFIGAFAAYLLRPHLATVAVFVVVIAYGNRLIADSRSDRYAVTDPCKTQSDIYLAIVDAASWLGALDPSYTRVHMWFGPEETLSLEGKCKVSLSHMAGSITTMAFLPYIVDPYPMPDVEALKAAPIQAIADDESILAIMTANPGSIVKWDQRMTTLGLAHREMARHRVPLLGSGFMIYAWIIGQRPPAGVVFADPIVAITDHVRPEINVYGSPKGTVAPAGDRVVFTPTDPGDHLAYPWAEVQATSDEVWARLDVESPVTNARSCRVVVQDKKLAVITSVGCASATRYFKLPAGTTAIRVYMQDPTRHPFALPKTIEVSSAAP